MNPEKEKLLDESYEKIIQVSLNMIPYEDISDLVDQKIMGYGTTAGEKLFSFQEYETLIKSQAEQMSGLDSQIDRERITRIISQDENTAFYAEELTITIRADHGENRLFARTTCVMEYINKQWKVTHWHGSAPVDTENNHRHEEEWKREKEKLRKQVDEQRAELQEKNRELEIEASLERVRAKAMAMHSTKDIESATAVVFNELSSLGIDMERCGIVLINETPFFEIWSTPLSPKNKEVVNVITGHIDSRMHPMAIKFHQDWREKKEYSFYTLIGDEVREYYDKLEKQPDYQFPKIARYPDQQIAYNFFFNEGCIFAFTTDELLREETDIFKRFSKVFEQTYTRFLDLQKAEEQAREAEIESSLERIRAKAMAMHSTKDIESATAVVFNELSRLGIDMERCGINLMNETPIVELWSTTLSKESKEVIDIVTGYLDFRIHPLLRQALQDWREKKDYSRYKLAGEEVRKYYAKLAKQPEYKFPKAANYPNQHVLHAVNFSEGQIFVFTKDELSAEKKNIIQRFTKVFEQTYTRFLDLQKSEEQAREAEIEASLERLRSKSMAKHNSGELLDVVSTLFDELNKLGIAQTLAAAAAINIYLSDSKSMNVYVCGASDQGLVIQNFVHPYSKDKVTGDLFNCRKQQPEVFVGKYSMAEKDKFYKHLFKNSELRDIPKKVKTQILETKSLIMTAVPTEYFIINVMDLEGKLLSEDDVHILKRFSSVFKQAYIRFLDIQKAEAQAREAQIEAALERIRSRSMAMQSSGELSEVVRVMYDEVEKLEICNWGCALMIFDNKNKKIQLWFSENVNKLHARPYDFDNLNHELVRKWWDFWKNEDEFMSIHLKGEESDKWTNYMFEHTGMKDLPKEVKEAIRSENEVYFEYAKMKQGLVSFINLEPFPEEIFPVLKRIARTFEQAYTRFLDVERAEKLALETSRQASLDRIRAEIASMRSSEDLQQITPIIWDELKTLEIPFIRCGVFIIDEEMGISHTYLSTSQGDAIAALQIPIEGISFLENVVVSWQNRKVYTEHWDKQGFRAWTQNLIDKGFIDSKEKYEAGSAPETLNLHFLPFKQGMLYIGNTDPLSQKDLDLGQSMAKAFSVAYQRYEDFNKLEQAKQKIEEAFRELEAAKDQLVQQEKLASLGQLTAGIAHEIKNPLNFVNNFSELSIEMIEEARVEVGREMANGKREKSPFEGGKSDEVVQGDDPSSKSEVDSSTSDTPLNPLSRGEAGSSPDLILEILDDIEANLRKIHEHGSRADSIVKSMLQHSRGGSGKMEPTDVNALIKEYANLAFHGMRAGIDPINVDIELDLDENVGEVKIIGEDFSRVILNLCNNAFDAMREKMTGDGPPETGGNSPLEGSAEAERRRGVSSNEGYQPKLTVRTKSENSQILIEVQDNGPGIPNDIKDKILQPFFTTKKGTQGTGLGLSITNDIIKAHGGQIDIESEANKFTKISIRLNMH
jgi:signal transduction histidine kinase